MRKTGLAVLFLAMAGCGLMAQNAPATDANRDYPEPMGRMLPKLIHAVPAEYPSDAGTGQTRHTCVFGVVIGADGSVRSAELENAHPSPFDASALQAVKASTFSAASLNGRATPVQVQVAVTFRGDGKAAVPELERSGSFRFPKGVSLPDAEYSAKARRDKVDGSVLLSFVVTEDGTTNDIRVLRSLGDGLDEQAVKTVRRWQFQPATLDGEPVPTRIRSEMSFHIR